MHVLVYSTYVFDNCPRTLGIFGLVVPASFQFGEVFLGVFGVACPVVGHQVFIDQSCCIVTCGKEIGLDCRAREAESSVVADFGRAVFSFFRGYQDYTERGSCTVYGRRGCIFQHRDGLDVPGIDIVEVAFDTVDKNQWFGILVDRAETADIDVRSFIRLSRSIGDIEVGHGSLQGTAEVGNGTVFDFFRRYGINSSGQIGFFLSSVTDDYDFIQRFRVFGHLDIDRLLFVYFDRFLQISDIGKHKSDTRCGFDRIVSVDVGHRVSMPFRSDVYADERHTFLIGNLPYDCKSLVVFCTVSFG